MGCGQKPAYQRFVPLTNTNTAFDTKTGQQCVTAREYQELPAFKTLPLCVTLFTTYPD
jgi:hypothetical protein